MPQTHTADGHDGSNVPVPEAGLYNRTIVALTKLGADKREIAAREREIVRDFVSQGGSAAALTHMRRLQRMDPDDRATLIAELDKYYAYEQYF